MSRNTIFPGVVVDSIEVRSGGGGRIMEFDEGLPEMIPTELIQKLINKVPMFGSSYTDSVLVYNLQVAAISPVFASTKARSFARAKNPFEASVIGVKETEMIRDPDMERKDYRVVVEVEK